MAPTLEYAVTLSWIFTALVASSQLIPKSQLDHICHEPFRRNTTGLNNFEVYSYEHKNSSTCVYLSLFTGIYSAAQRDCTEMGDVHNNIEVHLLTSKDETKNTFIKQHILTSVSFNSDIWLGLKWMPQYGWRWDDGDMANWLNNLGGDPTCAGNQPCNYEICAFLLHDATWGRDHCSRRFGKVYMCEWVVPPNWEPLVSTEGTPTNTGNKIGTTIIKQDGTILNTGVDVFIEAEHPENRKGEGQFGLYIGTAVSAVAIVVLVIVIVIFIVRKRKNQHGNGVGKQNRGKGQDRNMNVMKASGSSDAGHYELVPLNRDNNISQVNGDLNQMEVDHVYAVPNDRNNPQSSHTQNKPQVKVKPTIIHLGPVSQNMNPSCIAQASSQNSGLPGGSQVVNHEQLPALGSDYEDIDKLSERIKCLEGEHKALLGISDDPNPYEEPCKLQGSSPRVGQYDLERPIPRGPSILRQYSDYEEIDNMKTRSFIQQFNDDLQDVFEEDIDDIPADEAPTLEVIDIKKSPPLMSHVAEGEDSNAEITLVENDWYSA